MITKSKGFILLWVTSGMIFFAACGPTHTFNHMTYLADSVTDAQKTTQVYTPLVLEKGDRVSIKVNALDPETAQVYNGGASAASPVAAGAAGAISQSSATGAASSNPGYLIDDRGEIRFPQLGRIKAVGLTTTELADTIQNKLLAFIKEPVVSIELMNFQVNVLGEVNRPGTLLVSDGKITVIEAIGQAGDLTVNGLRDNILVVREKDGKREYGRINIASNNIFESPFYYLKQGDIVYVEMNRNKLLASDQLHTRRVNYLTISFAAVTALAIIYNSLRK